LGEGHRAKSLTGYALAPTVTHLGEKFPKPEPGGLGQLGLESAVKKKAGSQEMPKPAMKSRLVRITCA